MKEKTVTMQTVHQCNCCCGHQTLHPLVSVLDLAKGNWEKHPVRFDFYTVLVIESGTNDFVYGRQYYDYSNASLLFLTPGESVTFTRNKIACCEGRLLAFHPDLIERTSLGEQIRKYSFFFYKSEEALHLSLREKTKILSCLENIEEELQHAIDRHSKLLISRYIELLLDYCTRFYERQFITREEANKLLLGQTDRLLDEYIRSGKLKEGVLPSTAYCAQALGLSAAYFDDLFRFETGQNIREYFLTKRLEAAKRMLSDPGRTVSEVADTLGYPNVQYFSCLFKKLTGMAPNDCRVASN